MSDGSAWRERRQIPARRRRGRSAAGRDDLARGAALQDQPSASLLLAGTRLSPRRQLPRLHGRDRGRARAGCVVHSPTVARYEGSDSSERAVANRKLVFELLVADQPPRAEAHDPDSEFWKNATRVGVATSRFAARYQPAPDRSHPAMAVNLDACIQCNLCVRACREVQVNDVIGMAARAIARRSCSTSTIRWAIAPALLRRMRPGLPDRRAVAGDDGRRAQRRQAEARSRSR